MQPSPSLPSKRFNFKLFRVATTFWLLCIGNNCTMSMAVGSGLQAGGSPVVGWSQHEMPEVPVPVQRCLVHTLPEAWAVPALFWGSFWYITPLPAANSPTPHCSPSGQNQQVFAAFPTAGSQGQTESGLRPKEADEMVQELPNMFTQKQSKSSSSEPLQLSFLVTLELPGKP